MTNLKLIEIKVCQHDRTNSFIQRPFYFSDMSPVLSSAHSTVFPTTDLHIHRPEIRFHRRLMCWNRPIHQTTTTHDPLLYIPNKQSNDVVCRFAHRGRRSGIRAAPQTRTQKRTGRRTSLTPGPELTRVRNVHTGMIKSAKRIKRFLVYMQARPATILAGPCLRLQQNKTGPHPRRIWGSKLCSLNSSTREVSL